MTVQKLHIRKKRSINGITLDATLTEAHNSELEVTEHPIELGAQIADHAVVKPRELIITGEVSDTPLTLRQGENDDIVFAENDLFGQSTTDNKTRSKVAYEEFEKLQIERTLFSIQTGLKLYDNCLLVALGTTQDADTSGAVVLNMRFRQVVITQSQTVNINDTQYAGSQLSTTGGTRVQGTSTEKVGRKELGLPSFSADKSILKSLADAIRK